MLLIEYLLLTFLSIARSSRLTMQVCVKDALYQQRLSMIIHYLLLTNVIVNRNTTARWFSKGNVLSFLTFANLVTLFPRVNSCFTRWHLNGCLPTRQFSAGHLPAERLPAERLPAERLPAECLTAGHVSARRQINNCAFYLTRVVHYSANSRSPAERIVITVAKKI